MYLKVIFKINHFFVGYMTGRKNGGVRRTNFKNYSCTLNKKLTLKNKFLGLMFKNFWDIFKNH